MPAPYSAGSIFVSVLPSFKDNQNDIAREYTKRGRDASQAFSEGFDKQVARDLPKAMERSARQTRQAQGEAGHEAGREYSSRFRRTLVQGLKAAERDLEHLQGPDRTIDVPIGVDKDKFRRDFGALVRNVNLTRADLEVGADVGQALFDVDRLIHKLRQVRDASVDPEIRSSLTSGLGSLETAATSARRQAALEPEQPDPRLQRQQGAYQGALRSRLTSSLAALPPVEIDADVSEAKRKIIEFRADAYRLLDDLEADVDLDSDDTLARAKALMVLLEGVIETADPELEIDASFNAAGALAQIKAWVEAVDPVEVQVEPEMGYFRRHLADSVRAAAHNLPEVPIGADATEAQREIAAIRAELVTLAEDVEVGVDIEEARLRIRALQRQLAELRASSPEVQIDVDAARAIAALNAVEHAARDTDRHLRRVGRGADDGANSFRAFSGRVLGFVALAPLLIPAIGALVGALAAIGPLAIAAAGALGILALGVMGIGEAVKAMGNVELNAAKDAKTYADGVRNAARSLRSAEEALADARRASADGAVEGRERIEAANEGVVRAEEDLAQAQRDARRAQEDLTEARKQASERLLDLQFQIRGGALAERRAIMQLAEAEVAYANAMADPGATRTEREELLLSLQEQKLRLDEVRVSNRRLGEEQREANRTGVEGSDEVVAAQQRVRDSNQRVIEAQESVAESVAEVARAQADAQRAATDNARAIADAQLRLIDAQRDYTDAVNKTSSSQDQLAQSMAKLTPAGRDFAEYLYSLKGTFREFRETAAAGLLPGIQEWMQDIIGSRGPQLLRIVDNMSTAFGDVFRGWGEALKGEAWTGFFDMMEQRGGIFVKQIGDTLTHFGNGLASLMTAFAPSAQDFGDGLVSVSARFENWAAGLAETAGFRDFMDWWARVGPKVVAFFVALFDALVAIGKALAPYAEDLLELFTRMFNAIANMDTKKLGVIAVAVLGVAFAFQVLVGLNALVRGFQAATLLASAAMALFTGSATGLGAVLAGIAGTIALAVAALAILGVAIYLLWNNSETFRDVVTAVWAWIKNAVAVVVDWFQTYVVPVLQTVMDAIATGFKWLWENILQPIFSVWQTIWGVLWGFLVDMWNNVGQPLVELIWSIFQELWDIVGPIFELLWMAFKFLWDFAMAAWNTVGQPIFNAIIAVITFLWENIIDPVLGFIADAFGWLFGIIKSVWENVGKPVFDLFQSIVEALVGVFQGTFDGIKAIWDALLDVFMSPIVLLVDTVLNKGVIAGINWVASFFTDDDHWIPDIPTDWIPGQAYGGLTPAMDWAGAGAIPGSSPNKRADNVLIRATAGEYMHDVDAVDYYGVQAMDLLNRRLIPREWLYGGAYADGGLIYPQMMNVISNRFPNARITSTYRPGDPGYHGAGKAIDIAGQAPYPNATGIREMLEIDQWLARTFGSNIAELIHTGAGSINLKNGQPTTYSAATQQEHLNHVHWAMDSLAGLSGGRAVFGGGFGNGKPEDSIWGNIWDFISGPFDFLADIVRDFAGALTETPIGNMLLKIPMKIASGIADVLLELTGFGGGTKGYEKYLDETYYRTLGLEGGASVQEQVRAVASGYGWGSGPQWSALYALINKESSWNPDAANPTSSARGLFQKMTSIHGPVENTPAAQAQWGLEYILERYGDPMSAWAWHMGHNWYNRGGLIEGLTPMLHDDGGIIDPGWNLINNATRRPEASLNPEQLASIHQIADRGAGPLLGSLTVPVMNGPSASDIADEFEHRLTVASRGGKYED